MDNTHKYTTESVTVLEQHTFDEIMITQLARDNTTI